MLLTPGEVAKFLRIDRHRVYQMLDRGELPHVELGERTRRIPQAALDRWIEEAVHAPKESTPPPTIEIPEPEAIPRRRRGRPPKSAARSAATVG